MTRINSAIKVQLLVDEMLLAEAREIKRICSNYTKRLSIKDGLKNLPPKFTLGTGHVLFFVDKGGFTLNRYKEIRSECLKRGFVVSDFSDNWCVYENNMKTYKPNDFEKNLLIERISERLIDSKKEYWHYNREKISKENAIKLLNQES